MATCHPPLYKWGIRNSVRPESHHPLPPGDGDLRRCAPASSGRLRGRVPAGWWRAFLLGHVDRHRPGEICGQDISLAEAGSGPRRWWRVLRRGTLEVLRDAGELRRGKEEGKEEEGEARGELGEGFVGLLSDGFWRGDWTRGGGRCQGEDDHGLFLEPIYHFFSFKKMDFD